MQDFPAQDHHFVTEGQNIPEPLLDDFLSSLKSMRWFLYRSKWYDLVPKKKQTA